MITLTILLIVALLCVLVGCLTGLLTLVGVLASLFVGVLVGALAGYLAGRFMGTETSLGRNILMGVLGSYVLLPEFPGRVRRLLALYPSKNVLRRNIFRLIKPRCTRTVVFVCPFLARYRNAPCYFCITLRH